MAKILITEPKICLPSTFIRTPYNYDRREATIKSGLACLDDSLAAQDQKDDADINVLVKRFGITGKMPTTTRLPQSGDFTGVGTYHECLNAIKTAQNAFYELPASVRARFHHDPQELLDFVNDEKNAQEGEKLGLWQLRKNTTEAATGSTRADDVVKKGEAEKPAKP